MVDNLSPDKRSKIMRSIRSADTRPEMAVRRMLYSMGYRYRLHRKDIPGCPDIVFIGRRKAVFVHGCFWHVHEDCDIAHIPKNAYWRKKLKDNKKRDSRSQQALTDLGWKWMIVWECDLVDARNVRKSLRKFLGHPRQICAT